MNCKKVFVLGLDGGTFNIINPMIKKGLLPNIKKIIDNGTSGILKSTIPPATLPAWPSFFTGKNPGKHSIFDFFKKDENQDKKVLNCSKDIKSDKIWNILDKYDKASIIINIPSTYPPEELNGIMVTGMLTPNGKKFTYPEEFESELKHKIPDYIIEPDKENSKELFREIKTRFNTISYLIERYEWDFFAVLIRSTDVAQHTAWYNQEFIYSIYENIDRELSKLLTKLKDINIMIISDHGFCPYNYNVHINSYLEQKGFLSYKKDKRDSILIKSLKQIGITKEEIFNLLGHLGLQRILKKITPKSIKNMIPSYSKDIDWKETKASFSAAFTTENNSIQINLKGREPQGIVKEEDYEKVKEELIKILYELKDPDNNKNIITKVIDCKNVFKGPYTHLAPDLILEFDSNYKADLTRVNDKIITKTENTFGRHDMNGIFLSFGPDIKPNHKLNAEIIDLAPTILNIIGIEIPEDMDGKVLKIFKKESKTEIVLHKDIKTSKEKEDLKKAIMNLKL